MAVCGNRFPFVSGNMVAANAANVVASPKSANVTMGLPTESPNEAISGATMPPMRPNTEHQATPVFLTGVAYNSAVYTYNTYVELI